jgi:hypothetical protein
LKGRQRLGRRGKALGRIPAHQPLQLLAQGRFPIQGRGPTPLQGLRIEQAFRRIPTEQHKGHHPQGVEVHPGLGGCTPQKFGRGIARGRSHHTTLRTLQEAEIQEHRQAVAVAAQHIGGGEIAMEQILAVQRHKHGQQLAKEQEHFTGAKHQLPLLMGCQQLLVGATRLPLPRKPEGVPFVDRRPHPGHLGMQDPLEPGPELAGLALIPFGPKPPQGRRGLSGEGIPGEPELPLGVGGLTEGTLESIATSDHLPHGGHGAHHWATINESRWGWLRPLEASQSAS